MQMPGYDDWYAQVKAYTMHLVNMRSVSPGEGEIAVAREVLNMLQEDGLEHGYTSIGFDPLVGDTFGRQNVYAFLRGSSPHTIILLGHIDTVDTQDYGTLEPFALDPEALAQMAALTANIPAWQQQADATSTGGYHLPLEAIQQLNLSVINLGPYGKGAHQTGERALISYSFGILPQLLCEAIKRLAQEIQANMKL